MTQDCQWEEEVKKALGPKCYNLLLKEVDANRINVKHTLDIARMLNERVGGNFDKASNAQNFKYDRNAFRNVLSDWILYAPKEVTLPKLLGILSDENIALNALAHTIENMPPSTPDETETQTHETHEFGSLLRRSLQLQNPPRPSTAETTSGPSPSRGNDSGVGTRKPSLDTCESEANNQNPTDVAIEMHPLATSMGPACKRDRQASELQPFVDVSS